MPTFAVDWDGTCVEQKWPAQGKWLPGAVDALHTFDRLGTVIIHSVRIAPVKPFTENKGIPAPGEEKPIHPHRVRKEINYIRRMLDKAGLSHVEIWQRPYKPPAAIYIDDRALRFTGDWNKTVDDALLLIQHSELPAAESRLNSGIFMGHPIEYWLGLQEQLEAQIGGK